MNTKIIDNKTITILLLSCIFIYSLILFFSISYNVYSSFFPISLTLEHDEAEHLHVAYLISEGKRPFIDFIENHPTLFNNYLRWLKEITGADSTREWAHYARVTIFSHFIVCLIVFCLWISKIVRFRPKKWLWFGFLLCSIGSLHIYNDFFSVIFEIRPDWICYTYTISGCYLIFLFFRSQYPQENNIFPLLLLIMGGMLIGVGNAILPKGIIILLAFMLTFISKCIIDSSCVFNDIRTHVLNNIKPVLIFSIICVFSFITTMCVDCYLSNIDPYTWFKGVFLLNQKKHILLSTLDDSPITTIISFFSVSLPVLFLMTIWFVWEVNRLYSNHRTKEVSDLILLSFYLIFCNVVMGSYSNGVALPHYFIPSLFAAVLLLLALYLRLYYFFECSDSSKSSKLSMKALFMITGALIAFTNFQPIEASSRYQIRKIDLKEVRFFTKNDFLTDEVLPHSLIYFTRYPQVIPVQAHHWGYHFMLVSDLNIWRDAYELGLGPDPSNIWQEGSINNYPDVIAFENLYGIVRLIMNLGRCQQIDAMWLLKFVKNNYIRMQYRSITVYVRRDLVAYFKDQNWKICSSDEDHHYYDLISCLDKRYINAFLKTDNTQ